jgi:3-hydroxyacyl-[acyl-carrier-protein] dehydratase
MRFTLIDRIIELEPGTKIAATKNLSLAEEYLADHFPRFPVMPGVLMVEAMVQTSAWLVRATEGFTRSAVLLKEARNVRFGSFVQPGQTLLIRSRILDHGARETRLEAQGLIDNVQTVSARLTLESYNLADADPSQQSTDRVVIGELEKLYRLLTMNLKAPTLA